MKEEIKEILENQRKEYQNYLGVLSEDFKSQIKLIAETLSGQQEQLLALKKIAEQNAETIINLQTQVLAIKEMVAQNTKDITIIKMDIQFIKQELKHKVDLEEFEILEKRVSLLESERSR